MKSNNFIPKGNGDLGAFACGSKEVFQWGLTKREYFAGLAMQGMLSNSNFTNSTNDLIAIWSIQIADSLLEQLNKQ
jgi:hypothetical protein